MSDARPFIVAGDKTDHGGTVLEGSPCDTINGKMIARVGDKVHCPRSTCRGAQTIVEGDPGVMVDGSAAAFHGALTSCGARLIASQMDNLIGGSADSTGSEQNWNAAPNVSGDQWRQTLADADRATNARDERVGFLAGMDGKPVMFASNVAGPALKSNPLETLLNSDSVHKSIFKNLEHGELKEVKGIVLHRTDSTTAASTLSGYKAGQTTGAHFLIDADGSIYQTANLDKQAYHVGKIRSRAQDEGTLSTADAAAVNSIVDNKSLSYPEKVRQLNALEQKKDYPSRYPTNADSLGIEVVGKYDTSTQAFSPPTAQQLSSTHTLVEALKDSYGLTNQDIYDHGVISYKDPKKTEGSGLGY